MSNMCESNVPRNITLGEMMVPDPVCVTRDTSLADAIGILDDRGFDQLPVVTDHASKQLVGALTSRQVAICWLRELAAEAPNATVSEAMKAPLDGLIRNPQDEMSDELLGYFRTYDFVVVVDDQLRVIGIVQLWDVAQELWNARSNS